MRISKMMYYFDILKDGTGSYKFNVPLVQDESTTSTPLLDVCLTDTRTYTSYFWWKVVTLNYFPIIISSTVFLMSELLRKTQAFALH